MLLNSKLDDYWQMLTLGKQNLNKKTLPLGLNCLCTLILKNNIWTHESKVKIILQGRDIASLFVQILCTQQYKGVCPY